MTPTHIFSLNDQHPPNVNHSIVLPALILKIVKSPSNMTVTIVTTYVVHPLFVGSICSANTLVVTS